MKVLITGGTGLIGKALTKALLSKGHEVHILSRSGEGKSDMPAVVFHTWDINRQTVDPAAISSVDVIVHLAGAGIADRRWTKARKQEIAGSRVRSAELLVKALKEIPNQVNAVVGASAIGWYGPDPVIPNPKPFVEQNPSAPGFLGETCKTWEESLAPVEAMGKRRATLRTGIVLSEEGGALAEFRKPLRAGVAAVLGSGRQVISWVHIDDLVNLYMRAIQDTGISGTYNAVAPFPVSNKELTVRLAELINGKFFVQMHVPAFVLKMALGEMSIEVLKSCTVSSGKIQVEGYDFLYPRIEDALKNILKK